MNSILVPVSRLALMRHRPPIGGRAFLNIVQTVAVGMGQAGAADRRNRIRRKAPAIVLDFKAAESRIQFQAKNNFACLGMFDDVVQDFFHRQKKIVPRF